MIGTHLLNTDRAKAWLEQFSEYDRVHAALLLESLHLVERTTVEAAILKHVEQNLAPDGSTALFAIRELDPEIPPDCIVEQNPHDPIKAPFLRVNGEKVFVTKAAIREFRRGEMAPLPYFPVDKSVRPASVRPGTPTGSEGPMANLIRDFCKRAGSSSVLDHPSLEEMKLTKTKTMVLIDDLIGSGTRLRTFLRGFFNHKTIRSWRSLKLFELKVVSFAASMSAKGDFDKDSRLAGISTELLLPFGSSDWIPPAGKAVEDICRRYSHRTSRPGIPFGYGDAFTCICFDYKCPNSAAPILWAGSTEWMALFQPRPNLDFPVWPAPPDPIDREKRVLSALGQTRLASADYDKYVGVDGRRSLVMLGFVAKRLRTVRHLAAALGISETACAQLVLQNQARGWLSPNLRITEAGKSELEHARRLDLVDDPSDVKLSDDYYVPQSLRASRD